jgi:MYXO-CTERM domain-containing protein
MKTSLGLLLFALASPGQGASVFFSQATAADGTPLGGLSGTANLPVYAPIRETADSQILGYAEVTLGASSSAGAQVASFPRTDGTDTYIYQQVAAGTNAFTELNFRFVSSGGTGLPVPSTTIGVSEVYIRVDSRALSTGGGFVTPEETNTLTLAGTQPSEWEVVSDLGIVNDSILGGTLTYEVSETLDGASEFIQWRAFDPEDDDSITGLTWRLDNNGGVLNATHLQIDLSPVPEPAAALLGALGLLGLVRRRR